MMRLLRHPAFVVLARALFWLALSAAVVLALLPNPPPLPIDRLGDKFEHAFAFAVLGTLAALGFPNSSVWRRIGGLSVLGALIEVFQALPAIHRDFDVQDLAVDTASVIVVTGIAALILPASLSRPEAADDSL